MDSRSEVQSAGGARHIDPLGDSLAGEIELGTPEKTKVRLQAFSARLKAYDSALFAMEECRGKKDAWLTANTERLLADGLKNALELQASLLLAYFGLLSRLRPIALEYLEKWFIDSNLEADRLAFERFVELSKAYGMHEKLAYGMAGGLFAEDALERWKECEAKTVRELVEQERERKRWEVLELPSWSDQLRAEAAAKFRVENEKKTKKARKREGLCALCGKPFRTFTEIFKGQHKGCTTFIE